MKKGQHRAAGLKWPKVEWTGRKEWGELQVLCCQMEHGNKWEELQVLYCQMEHGNK